jgi:hypothetical protein
VARSEARISVDIWDDPEFLVLSPGAQRTYMLLLSQRDLAHDGVIALRERRWARCAAGVTVDQLTAELEELHQARFVVVDVDSEELLVRSLLRRDKIYKQPNVLRAAADHLSMVSSPAIRRALAEELVRIADEPMPDGSRPIVEEMRAALPDPSENPPPNPSEVRRPDPSGNPSEVSTRGTPGERGELQVVGKGVSPYPVPRTVRPPAGDAAAPAANPPTAQALIAEWIDHCDKRPPGRVIGQLSKELKALLDEGINPDDVRRGLAAWHQRGLHPSTLASVVNEAMNSRPTARASPQPSTTERKIRAALDAGARVQAIFDQQQQPRLEVAS